MNRGWPSPSAHRRRCDRYVLQVRTDYSARTRRRWTASLESSEKDGLNRPPGRAGRPIYPSPDISVHVTRWTGRGLRSSGRHHERRSHLSIPDGMADVWEILDPEYSAGLATALSMQLAERGGRCVPFARRRDDDDLACLSGDGRIAIVHPNWGDGRESGWSRFHVPDDQGTMRLKFFNAPRRVGCFACGARCGAVWNVTCSNDELEYLGSCRMPVGGGGKR